MTDWFVALLAAHPEPIVAALVALAIARWAWGRLKERTRKRVWRWAGRLLWALVATHWARSLWRTRGPRSLPVPGVLGGRTSLYRFYDIAGRLLYVGITCRGAGRWAQHSADKDWWPLVAHTKVQHFATRDEARLAEAIAIQDENPIYNRQRPDPYRLRRRAS